MVGHPWNENATDEGHPPAAIGLIPIRAADLYGSAYRRTVWHAERTFYNTLGVAKWHMSRRVHELGYKVVVTGEGADEMYSGYPFLKRDYFRHDPEGSGAGHAATMERSNSVFQGAILSERDARHPAFDELVGFTPSWIQPWLLTLERVRPLLSAELEAELEQYDPVQAVAERIDPRML